MPSLKRTRERAPILLALLGIVAIVAALSVGILGYLAAAATAGVRDDLDSLPAVETELRMTLEPAPDPEAQDAAVRALLGSTFRDGDRTIPLDIDRTLRSVEAVPVALVSPSVAPRGAVTARSAVAIAIGAGSREGSISEVAELVGGSWQTDPTEVSVNEELASALGVAPGTAIRLGEAPVTVTGVWRLRDDYGGRLATDPFFSAATGADTAGPVIVDEAALPGIGVEYRVQWAITPVISTLEGTDLSAVQRAWASVPAAVRSDDVLGGSDLDRFGRLITTAIRLQGRVAALGAIAPVALLIVAAIALMTVLELARLLSRLRMRETALLWSRGASARGITGSSVLEATLFAVVGVILGVTVGGVAVFTLGSALGVGGGEAARAVLPTAAGVTAVILIAVAGVTALITGRSVTAVSRDRVAAEAGRLSRVGVSGAALLLIAAAGLSMWQLLVYGSPIAPARDGGTQVDPVAVLAPALCLLAAVVAGFAVIGLLAAPLDRRARRSVGLGGSLVTRSWRRRLPQLATPFALAALACGQLVFAAGYAGTWDRAYSVSTLRAGSEVRLAGLGRDLTPAVLGQASTVAGVEGVAPVVQSDTVVGSAPTSFVAATPAAIEGLVADLAGVIDTDAAAEAIAAPTITAQIPAEARSLEVQTTTDGFTGPPELTLVLTDPLGRLTRLPASGSADGGPATAELRDAGTGPWRLQAVDLAIPPEVAASVPEVDPPTFAITGITTDDGSTVELGDSWVSFDIGRGVTIPSASIDPSFPELDTGPPRLDVRSGELRARLMPSLVATGDTIRPPIAVSQALADGAGLSVGDVVPISVDTRWTDVSCRISAVFPAIPGATDDSAVLMDAGVVQSILLRSYVDDKPSTAAWVGVSGTAQSGESSGDSERADVAARSLSVAKDLRAALPVRVIVSTLAEDPTRAILGSSVVALWIGAIGTALLTIIALAAASRSQLRDREEEVFVLGALGVASRQTARLRVLELGAVLAVGAAAGIAAGTAIAVLAAPAISRSALPDLFSALPVTAVFDPVALPVAIGAFVLATAAVVLLYGRAVRAQARTRSRGRAER